MRLIFAAVVMSAAAPIAAAAAEGAVVVKVSRADGIVTIKAELLVDVAPPLAWQVLTDYENMASFLPNIQSSKVLERRGNKLRVVQGGAVGVGVLSIPFEYNREVDLNPISMIQSTSVGGSLKSAKVTTLLAPEGEGTRITYDSEAVPAIWVPLGISEAFIRRHIQAQLESMRREMLRRKAAP